MFDIHCHILFGVDDGARDLRESQNMLHASRQAGIDTIVCTPHCRGKHFHPDRIAQNFEVLSHHADQMGITLQLGYEVYCEKLLDLGIETAPNLCIQDTNLLLLEFSCASMPPNWQRVIFELQGMGIQPIIAHPERYVAVQKNLEVAEEMKRMGCLLQLSGNFAAGGFGSKRKKAAQHLLSRGLVDYVASDAHCVQDYLDYKDALSIAQRY